MIEFDFEQVHMDGGFPMSWHEALLRVVALFTVRRSGVALWSEVEVPILEFAYGLRLWLLIRARSQAEFLYQPMDSDDAEWLWFRPTSDHWALGAGSQLLADGLALDDLKLAAARFLDRVVEDVPVAVGVDAEDVISRPS